MEYAICALLRNSENKKLNRRGLSAQYIKGISGSDVGEHHEAAAARLMEIELVVDLKKFPEPRTLAGNKLLRIMDRIHLSSILVISRFSA